MRSFVPCLVAVLSLGVPVAAQAEEAAGPVVELSADDGSAAIEKRTGTSGPSGLGLLETGALSAGHWQHACVAPCAIRLDSNFAYRVAGEGLVPTGSFVLPRGGDRVHVDAHMGSSPARVSGMLLAGAGVFAVVAGGLALGASPILASEEVGSEGFRTGVLAGGLGAVTVGAIASAVGLFLWLSNGSTAQTKTVASSSSSFSR